MYEAELFRKLRHPSIVRLIKVFAQANSLYVVFDLVVGGELMHEITERQCYAEVDASHCMQQILEAINFCHKKGVVHCDLKPENILLVSRQKGAAIKIADFGLAAEVQGDEHSLSGISVTLYYRAPEIIQEKHYGKPVDLWSCGVIRNEQLNEFNFLISLLIIYSPSQCFFWCSEIYHSIINMMMS